MCTCTSRFALRAPRNDDSLIGSPHHEPPSPPPRPRCCRQTRPCRADRRRQVRLDVPDRAREACRTVGWEAERIAATTFTADAAKATSGNIEVIVEATGNPAVGIRHARAAIAHGKHIVMVNVEADAVAGPLLARRAKAAGVVYSLAWGDQPALICEHVDWARAAGFNGGS